MNDLWWQWPLSQCGNRSSRLDYWSADLLNGCGRQQPLLPTWSYSEVGPWDTRRGEMWWWWSTDLENIVSSLLAAGSALVERGGNNLKFKVRTWEGENLGTRRIKRGMWSLLWRWASAHLEANFQSQRLVEVADFCAPGLEVSWADGLFRHPSPYYHTWPPPLCVVLTLFLVQGLKKRKLS